MDLDSRWTPHLAILFVSCLEEPMAERKRVTGRERDGDRGH